MVWPWVETVSCGVDCSVPAALGLGAQPLHGIHDIGLLRQEGVAERLRPVELAVHHLEDLGKRHQGFDAGIPVLLLERRIQLIASELRIVGILNPARGQVDLERVGRGHQDLGEQRIGIERDRREKLVELLRRDRPAPDWPAPRVVGALLGPTRFGPRPRADIPLREGA